MKPKEQNLVQSPYVVVLGGNSVRRKSTPPPDAHADIPQEKPEAPHVYGVVPPLKTMAHDVATVTAEKSRHTGIPETLPQESRKWWDFRRKKVASLKGESAVPRQKEISTTPGDTMSEDMRAQGPMVAHSRVIDVPRETDRMKSSTYRQRFMRGIAKKGYLTSKLAVELPFHAKVGALVALFVLVVGVPLLSRFVSKPAPVTAGTIVALGTEALVAQVSKSIELPTGETPLVVIATADDIRRLNVPDAKPGNKILLYQQTGKIVVYDAEGDKVLGVVNRAQP